MNLKILLIYIAVISAISVIITAADKINARKHRRRVPEKTLILFSVFGGSVAMYITMLLIRHKTLHKKFMLGIPFIIIIIQCIILYYGWKYSLIIF